MKAKKIYEDLDNILKAKRLPKHVKEFYNLKKFFQEKLVSNIYSDISDGMFYITMAGENNMRIINVIYISKEYNKIHINKKTEGWAIFRGDKKSTYEGLEKITPEIIKEIISYLYPNDLTNNISDLELKVSELQEKISKYNNIKRIKNS